MCLDQGWQVSASTGLNRPGRNRFLPGQKQVSARVFKPVFIQNFWYRNRVCIQLLNYETVHLKQHLVIMPTMHNYSHQSDFGCFRCKIKSTIILYKLLSFKLTWFINFVPYGAIRILLCSAILTSQYYNESSAVFLYAPAQSH